MRYLLLIRHAAPVVERDLPPDRWRLSDAGRQSCAALAERVAPYRPGALVASEEPKAAETAALLAAHLGMPWRSAPGLHEHRRGRGAWLDRGAWEAQIARLFAEPDTLVFGQETAAQARTRFAAAVDRELAACGGETLALVAHGTVITLLLAQRAGVDPLPFWRGLALPDLAAVRLPDFWLQRAGP
jgi:broad specificity phosphatase PhoE